VSSRSTKTHITTFAGLPVVEWQPDAAMDDAQHTVYRVGLTYLDGENARWTDKFAAFMSNPAVSQITALVIGDWHAFDDGHEAAQVVAALVAARAQLPHLTALFLGDITEDEFPPLFIEQADVSPLLDAYPLLEHLSMRGSEGLRLGPLRHRGLRSLVLQSGGLPPEIVQDVGRADLPALEHLELWLGEDAFGGEATVADLAPILSGARFPTLRYLGLCNSDEADEFALAVAGAPILERVKVLDLSLGRLSDDGAAALLASPAVARLDKLDIHHHFCSADMVRRLKDLGVSVDGSDAQGAHLPYDKRNISYVGW